VHVGYAPAIRCVKDSQNDTTVFLGTWNEGISREKMLCFAKLSLVWRSSSFRLTGNGVNKPIMAIGVPRYAIISTWTGQGNMGRGANLTSDLPAVAGEATCAIESENDVHLCLSRSRGGDADALRKRT